MFYFISKAAIAAALYAIKVYVFNKGTKVREEFTPDFQAEWLGYYNQLEATLLIADPKVYNEDIAKAALIFSGATYYGKYSNGFDGCLPDFKINTQLSTTIDSTTIGGFVGDYNNGKYIVAAFEGTGSNWQLLNEWANIGPEGWPENLSFLVVKYWNYIAKDQISSVTTALRTLIAKYPAAPVIVTGHSLGAATATLVLAHLFANAEA